MHSRHHSICAWRGSILRAAFGCALSAVLVMVPLLPARAQGVPNTTLDTLIARALTASPRLQAARSRTDAARARIAPAGLWPEPMLMAGVQNLPLASPNFRDDMTMKMLGITQSIPLWGKPALARSIAQRDADVAELVASATALEVRRDVQLAAYDVAYVDRVLEVLERNRLLLIELIRGAESRFGVGAAGGTMPSGLAEIMRARADAARLADQASALHEERRTALARLNALLDRPSDAPASLVISQGTERAAVAAVTADIRFESATLGSRAGGSPIPSVDSLQRLALQASPELRMGTTMTDAQSLRVELAHRERRPDIEATIQYGQRDRYPDMVTALVSVPLPLRRRERHDQHVAEARSELSALDADRRESVRRVNVDVARLHSAVERARTQLALSRSAMLPQARLAVEAARVSFQSGGGSLQAVLEAQMLVFNAEIAWHRALADFARAIAELEHVVGAEVIHD